MARRLFCFILISMLFACVECRASDSAAAEHSSSGGYAQSADLSGMWRLSKLTEQSQDKGPALGYANPGFDDSSWIQTKVPNNWYFAYPIKPDAQYVCGWYRMKFTAGQENSGQRVILNFERVDTNAEVYVNGTDAGGHRGGYTPFALDITDHILWGEPNTIALRCVHDVNTEAKMKGQKIAYLANWTPPLGGILGPVQLTYNPSIYIERACINPNISGNDLGVDLVVRNTLSQPRTLELYGMVSPWKSPASGTNQHIAPLALNPGSNTVHVTVPMPANPTLWSPDNPYLYLLTLRARGRLADGLLQGR